MSSASSSEHESNPLPSGAEVPEPVESAGTDWHEVLVRLGPVKYLAGVAALLPALGGFTLLYFINPVAEWLRGHQASGVGLFIVGFAVSAGLALLPTYAQALLAGWAFGAVTGSLAALAGITGAALIGYGIAWRGSGHRVTALIRERPKWQAVYDALLDSGAVRRLLIVTLIRIPPNSPFAITNLVLAATRVPPLTYAVGTLVGIAPRTIAFVYIGSTLVTFTTRAPALRWMTIIGIVLLVIVLAVIGTMANRALARIGTAGSAGSVGDA